MKTPMNVFNTAMQKKKKKNRKGFSLVELIVVLVIMAILAAALIPSLMGYIRKTKEQNVQSECQASVQAAQTIASGIYASSDGHYKFEMGGAHDVTNVTSAAADVKALAEVPGTISNITVNADNQIATLTYVGEDGKTKCDYSFTASTGGSYTPGIKS